MPEDPRSRSELQTTVEVCQLVARLVKAKLPLSSQLARIANDTHPATAALAEDVEQRLAAGQSLTNALAADNAPQSRILAACIEAGERSGRLDEALQDWFGMHLANWKSNRALRAALLYPSALILIALISFALAIWHLVPQYEANFALFHQELPSWLRWVGWCREHFLVTVLVMVCGACTPPLVWLWTRRGLDPAGLPREPTRRNRQQALAIQIARRLLDAQVPLKTTSELAVQVAGGGPTACQNAFSALQNQQVARPLTVETSLILASLHAGTLTSSEACDHLLELSDHYLDVAEMTAGRHARWIPMLVALTVGLLTVTVYVGLVYLPWIWLMRMVVDPATG